MIAVCQPAVRARMQNRCVVCGPDNPRGLRISYARQEDGAVTADWCPSEDWEGFQGIVHGGIISTVLDEAMSKAVAAASCEALTGELKVRFRLLVASREPLHIRGCAPGSSRGFPHRGRRLRTRPCLGQFRGAAP